MPPGEAPRPPPAAAALSRAAVPRILAVDWGERRVGLAVSDPGGIIATGLDDARGAHAARRPSPRVARSRARARPSASWSACRCSCRASAARRPRPRSASPTRSRERSGLPVETYDERLTSALSERRLREVGRAHRAHAKGRVDQGAAIALLESYLLRLQSRGGASGRRGRDRAVRIAARPRRSARGAGRCCCCSRRWSRSLADLFLPAGPFPPTERRVVLVQRGQTLREIAERAEARRADARHARLPGARAR